MQPRLLHCEVLQAVDLLHIDQPQHRSHFALRDQVIGLLVRRASASCTPEDWFICPIFSSSVICFSRDSARAMRFVGRSCPAVPAGCSECKQATKQHEQLHCPDNFAWTKPSLPRRLKSIVHWDEVLLAAACETVQSASRGLSPDTSQHLPQQGCSLRSQKKRPPISPAWIKSRSGNRRGEEPQSQENAP